MFHKQRYSTGVAPSTHMMRAAYKYRNYIIPSALAYGARNLKSSSSGPRHSGLSGQGYYGSKQKGSAVPIKGKRQRRKPRRTHCKGVKGKAGKEICQIKKAIKALKFSENASLGRMTYRKLQSFRVISADNLQAVSSDGGNDTTQMETTLANLKYYDPANPGTLVTAAATTGTYQRNFLFKSITSKLVLRNNYQSDATVKIYLCKAKDDTDISPSTAWSTGIATSGNVSSITQLNQYPTDNDLFNDLYSVKVAGTYVLSPGQSCSVSHTEKDIEYDPATVDNHNLLYQKEYKAFKWMTVVSGVLSHDVSADDQGIAQAGVDGLVYTTHVVSYDAGVNLTFVHNVISLDTPATSFVQSHQPIADNQAYSVA